MTYSSPLRTADFIKKLLKADNIYMSVFLKQKNKYYYNKHDIIVTIMKY